MRKSIRYALKNTTSHDSSIYPGNVELSHIFLRQKNATIGDAGGSYRRRALVFASPPALLDEDPFLGEIVAPLLSDEEGGVRM